MKFKIKLLFVALILSAQTISAQIWTQVGSDIDGEAKGDEFGSVVSLCSDGSVVAVNVRRDDGAGHVWVYRNINGIWTQLGSDIVVTEEGIDFIGSTIALSSDGSTVGIGVPGSSDINDERSFVRVYQNINGTWTQIGSDIRGESHSDLGISVSLSSDGSIVATGGKGHIDRKGHVRIYQNINGSWMQIGSDIDGEAEFGEFGSSVSLSSDGSVVAIGGWGFESQKGYVRVFQNINGSWIQIGSDIYGEEQFDMSGYSVSLSSDGSTVAIGAPYNDGGFHGGYTESNPRLYDYSNNHRVGHVRVYQNNNGNWTQLGIDIDGEAEFDGFGISVSMCSDGRTLAVGSAGVRDHHEDYVRIYQYTGDSWVQIGSDIRGEASGEGFGASVSLSSDGRTVAIGAPFFNNGNGLPAGQVRIYKLEND